MLPDQKRNMLYLILEERGVKYKDFIDMLINAMSADDCRDIALSLDRMHDFDLFCQSCDNTGELDVCIGLDQNGNEKWEIQDCQNCNYIRPIR